MAGGGPVPGEILFCEIKEGASDVGVVGDEAAVEVGKAKERVDIFHLGWGQPTGNPIKFYWIHGQLTWFDDHAKVFDLIGGEFTFFELQMEV